MKALAALPAALALAVLSVAQPRLAVTSAAVAGVREAAGGANWTYLIEVTLPPLTRLRDEGLACVHGAEIVEVSPQSGAATVRGGCIFLTAENPTARPRELAVAVVVAERQREQPPTPVVAVMAAAALAAASYLALSERGEGKLLSMLSIPIAYHVKRRGDVARSPKRLKILEYIRANPGTTIRRISRETGISYGEVQWHLSVLERLGLVECARVGKYACCYPAGTPPEVWLARFAERELNLKLSPEALERAKLAVERGRLDLGELSLDPN